MLPAAGLRAGRRCDILDWHGGNSHAMWLVGTSTAPSAFPDLQSAWNPGGDSDSNDIFAGMLRAEVGFQRSVLWEED